MDILIGTEFAAVEAQSFYREKGSNEMSEIALAKTLIHEVAHAKIASDGNSSKEGQSHNYFATEAVLLVKEGLMEYNNANNLGYSESDLEALSWEGSHSSEGFKNYINDKAKTNNTDNATELKEWNQRVKDIRHTKK